MRSYPYNIVFSKSLKDIRSMFFGLGLTKAQLSKYLDPQFSKTRKDTFIVSQRDNKGFIEMEFDRTFSQKKFQVILKFVETSEIIEFFAFNNDPVESVIKESILTQIRNASTDEARDKIVNEYSDYLNTFYLAFGVGDDITNWTGPLALTLTNAHLSIREDGIREVELIFTPDSSSYKLYHNMNLASFARTQGTDGYGKVLSSKLITTAVQSFKHDGTKPYPNKAGNSWNYHVRQLLIKYLSQIYKNIPVGNILPLFSKDLDLPGKSKDASINIPSFGEVRNLADLASSFKSFGIILSDSEGPNKVASSPMPESTQKIMASKGFAQDPQNPSKASPAASPSNSKQDLIQSLIDNPDELIPFDKGLGDNDRTYIVQQRAKRRERDQAVEAYMEGDFNNPYLRRELSNAPLLNYKSRKRDNLFKESAIKGRSQDVLNESLSTSKVITEPSNTNIDSAAETDKDTTSQRKPGTAKIMMRSVDSGGKGSITDSLNEFSKALINDGQQTTDIVLIEESDLFILKSLRENGLIEDDTSPIILFGEREVIRSLIYSIDEKRIESGKSTLPPTTNIVVSYEDQPTEDMLKAWDNHLNNLYGYFGNRGNTSCYREKPVIDRLTAQKDYFRDVIVFAHNTKNSNILNIELDDKVFFNHFKSLLIDSEVRSHAANIKASQILKNAEVDLEEIEDYLRHNLTTASPYGPSQSPSEIKFEILRKLYDEPDNQLIKLIKSKESVSEIDTLDFVEIITFMLSNKSGQDLTESTGTVKVVPNNVSRAYIDLVSDLRRLTRSVTLKTLPFFNHGSKLWYADCFLYALGNSIKGATQLNQVLKTPTFFSGGYQITAYRHVITKSDAYSEFKLVKQDVNTSNPLGSYVSKPLKEFLKDKGLENISPYALPSDAPDASSMGPRTLKEFRGEAARDVSEGLKKLSTWTPAGGWTGN